VFLHYVLDLRIEWWRKNRCRGDVVIVRYADDFVMGFEHRHEAEVCLETLRERFAKFGLKLNEEKTRLIEFGRFAAERRRSQRSRWTWPRMQQLVRRHLPRPRILHPYPEQRYRARLKARAV